MPMDVTPRSLPEERALIEDRLRNPGINVEIRVWAIRRLKAIQQPYEYVRRGDAGYQDYLLSVLDREADRYHATDVDAIPWDSLREEPLCTCSDGGCPLKHGQLPLVVREAETVSLGIFEFKHTHSGTPVVLDNPDGEPPGARQRWAAMRGEVWSVHERVKAYLSTDVEEPPDTDEDDVQAADVPIVSPAEGD